MGERDDVGEVVEGQRGDGVDLVPGERAALLEQGDLGVGKCGSSTPGSVDGGRACGTGPAPGGRGGSRRARPP